MTKHTPEKVRLAVELFGQGKPYTEIGKRCGVGRQTIAVWLEKAGVTEPKGVETFWNPEREAELTRLVVVEGYGARRAAKALGCTKSTAYQKARRLGLPLNTRPDPAAKSRVPKAPKAPPVKSTKRQNATLAARAAQGAFSKSEPRAPMLPSCEAATGLATTLDLRAHMCRWPMAMQHGERTFCGARRRGEGPYCAEHGARAYQPPAPGRPRTGNEIARSIRRYP